MALAAVALAAAALAAAPPGRLFLIQLYPVEMEW
jgi:hypothetical protein